MNSLSPDAPDEDAFRQVLAHRTMLKAYVQAIVRDPFLAEDTFSDVTLEIARSWPRFDQERSFQTWARGVARRVALANLRKAGRQPLAMDNEVLESIAQEFDRLGAEPELEIRKQTLRECLAGLRRGHRHLVQLRYFEERPYAEISQALGRTIGALYVMLNRIHTVLAQCVERKIRSV